MDQKSIFEFKNSLPMKKFILSVLFLFAYILSNAQHGLIPAPVSYEYTGEMFMIDPQVYLLDQTENAQAGTFISLFQDYLSKGGVNTTVEKKTKEGKAISFQLAPNAMLGAEGYTIEVKENGVQITANAAAGIHNAIQTIKQKLPAEFESKDYPMGFGMLEGCTITDYPRFGWGGLMLDVSRHFFSVEEVKAFIDRMALYKFNVFHWHLTDDEGWRIEIKSLPKLTEIGAWRVERHGRFGDRRPYPMDGEKATYGGFYTQEQIKEVVQYAADRNITIVPEIDIPGHSMAALAAYPELSVNKEPKFVNPGSKFAEWPGDGTFKMLIENTLNPADEKVYEFVDKVMEEVAALFPGEYIHMGGDECYHGYWEENADVQKFMKKNNLKNSHELQSYFVKRVEKIVSSKGKKMIGWDEILEGGLADGAAVMSWRGIEGGIEAAKMGHYVVMSPKDYVYLDYTQGDHSVENKIYQDLSLEKTYSYEPIPEGIDPKYILGGQGNVWTEVIPNLNYAYYMTYPRAFAIAETFWSPKEKKEWNSFLNRTEMHFRRLDVAGVNSAKTIYEPSIHLEMKDGKLYCTLKSIVPNAEVYYSVDNTYPVLYAQKYQGPFEIPEGDLSLRTQTFRNGQPLGRELRIHRDDLQKRVRK